MLAFLSQLLITCLAVALVVSAITIPQVSSPELASPPRADAAKVVVAHLMVANTFHYTPADWEQDISLAASSGLDAFALNIGYGEWYPNSVEAAYTAALNYPNFKLFISFDMTSIPCSSADNADAMHELIAKYRLHPSQLQYKGGPLVSTFGGEHCYFGKESVNEGWASVMKRDHPGCTFIPSFFIQPAASKDYSVLDGIFPWNSAWPLGPTDISFNYDREFISGLRIDQSYMAGVSPWFFTHYGFPYNKNFIFRGDDWLLATRMEQLVQNRNEIGLVEVITWNDYGESHYVGPIHGDQPGSEEWVNGFDHQAWLPLLSYYITAFKTGVYPMGKERIFLWMRPHPTAASASDPLGRPANADWTEDYMWVVALLDAPGDITLSCGPSNEVTSFTTPGLQKAKLPLKADCQPHAAITRGGVPVVILDPQEISFKMQPGRYNFNAYVAASL
ncbi:glycoside hydrolase family 71 protein [Pleurotus ostreatus PC15]|uniref:Glycoside hydrolase family 71 protein n=1 Tax=Pleurotus ostreatus (strain PC15) TaxID=1137138 RepID=A0A067NHF0_PLEO1|nr:glycoside hydrolase family 71 protein [Pleurotus ostreatus PC15]